MNKAYLTDWTEIENANKIIKQMIDNGTYKKEQIKKSSNKFKNGKDKKDGYLTRVEVIPGIHPELEVEIKYRGTKTKTVDNTVKAENNDSFAGGLKIDGKVYRTIDTVMDLENNEYNFFCTDGDKYFIAKKKNIAGAVAEIAEGPMSEDENHSKWKMAEEKKNAYANSPRVMAPLKKAASLKPKPKIVVKSKKNRMADSARELMDERMEAARAYGFLD